MKTDTFLLNAISDIPLVKSGKGGIGELQSFHADIAMWTKMRNHVYVYPDKLNESIEKWKDFIRKRNDEDFIPHSKSKHYLLYKTLF